MKKLLCMLAVLAVACSGALAEGSGFKPGTAAGNLYGNAFFALSEGDTWALVRFSAVNAPSIVERADSIGDIVSAGDALYYLRTNNGSTDLICRNSAGGVSTVYSFGTDTRARALSGRGDNLFVLIDDMLHIIYPEAGICLKLAGAKMSEYVLADDYAYYISLTDTLEYALPLPVGGEAKSKAGCLYKLNLSTGVTRLLLKSGIEDLQFGNGRLYFHNLAKGYTVERGEDYWVAGELHSLNIEGDALMNVGGGYDWDYWVVTWGVVVYRGGELVFRDDSGGEKVICALGSGAEVSGFGDYFAVYEPDTNVFSLYGRDGLVFSAASE